MLFAPAQFAPAQFAPAQFAPAQFTTQVLTPILLYTPHALTLRLPTSKLLKSMPTFPLTSMRISYLRLGLRKEVVQGIFAAGAFLMLGPPANTITFAHTTIAAVESGGTEFGLTDFTDTVSAQQSCVVLLHGLSRTSRAMKPLALAFEKAGYEVVNVDYPSRHHPIEFLAPLAVDELGASQCSEGQVVHFVTHSLGGILVRYFLSEHNLPNLGKVVMLAPPNHGSEVVDSYRNVPGFRFLNGPAGMQLGTDDQSIPSQLPAVDFDLGVIAGSKTFNPILSLQLPNPDDGKVSAESARVEGMDDYLLLPVTHTFLMRSEDVIAQAIHFVRRGKFSRDKNK